MKERRYNPRGTSQRKGIGATVCVSWLVALRSSIDEMAGNSSHLIAELIRTLRGTTLIFVSCRFIFFLFLEMMKDETMIRRENAINANDQIIAWL